MNKKELSQFLRDLADYVDKDYVKLLHPSGINIENEDGVYNFPQNPEYYFTGVTKFEIDVKTSAKQNYASAITIKKVLR